MDTPTVRSSAAEGLRLLEAAQWDAARQAFEASLATADTPDARDGLGLALWFLGHVEDGIALRAQAFEAYARAGRCDIAARVGVWVSHQYLLAGRSSAARGWLARADRAATGTDCDGRGWIAVERARHCRDVAEQADLTRRAMAIARRSGDADLEVFALSLLGLSEVHAGRLAAGMELMEEAMAAATAGRVRNVHTLAEAYCNLIKAATDAGDWDRATEWCDHVDRFARDTGAIPLLGTCRTIHADVLVARGRWTEAEQALAFALDTHARFVPAMGASGMASMAELRVRQGRLAEAEQLLAGREEHASSLCALARLRIADGRPGVAVALLERALGAAEGDAVRSTRILAPLVEAHLATGDLDAADDAAGRLAVLAQDSGILVVEGRARLAEALVAVARGRLADAVDPSRRALAAFDRLGMPLDVGESRLLLARALLATAPDAARDEARAALGAFRELGAARAVDAAAAVLRELGEATGSGPRGYGDLTAREAEVLALLQRGMTNAGIAATLVISEKTAGHHVSRILAKLGVRNRAEAAVAARGAEMGKL